VLNTLEWEYDDWLRESSCSQELLEDIDERITEVKIESGAGISGVLFEPSERFPLYKSPPKREWVSLSKKEVQEIFDMDLGVYESIEETMRQLEEKNNG
jgi:hypothetical protein